MTINFIEELEAMEKLREMESFPTAYMERELHPYFSTLCYYFKAPAELPTLTTRADVYGLKMIVKHEPLCRVEIYGKDTLLAVICEDQDLHRAIDRIREYLDNTEIKGKLFTNFRHALIYGLNKEILDEF